MTEGHDVFWAAVVTAVPASLAAGAALSAARNSKRNRAESALAMDTGNEKKLGHTVHDIAQTVEIAVAQLHTNTTELLGVSQKLDRHLEETEPLVAQYKADLKARDA